MCGAIIDKTAPLPTLATSDWRRRSADLGGLLLATKNPGQGQGWLGGCMVDQIGTLFAEALSDMYNETVDSVNDNGINLVPTDLSESVRSRLIHALDRWNFEPHTLSDEEVIACTLILFETLFRVEGMQEAIPFSMQQISAFIHHLRRIYRYENTYHNFEHALDVLQACQSYLKSAGIIPSPTILLQQPNRLWRPKKQFDSGPLVSVLGLREVFILYIAAIGHDVGHPGLTNAFMKNARTRLSLLYNDSSALENMHYHFLLRLMKFHGLTRLIEEPIHGPQLRKLLFNTIIATDMTIHDDFMLRFQKIVEGEQGTLCMRQVIIAQAILKNADISNPSRPFGVSRHWAKALMKEWAAQAQFEEDNNLQPSVPATLDDPLKEAGSQIYFISTFVKPLLHLTVRAIPDMNMFLVHCKANLKTWKYKADIIRKDGNYSAMASTIPPAPSSTPHFNWYHTAFPLTLPNCPSTPSSYTPSTVVSTAPTAQSDSHGSSAPASPSEESVSGSSSSIFSPLSEAPSSVNGTGGWKHKLNQPRSNTGKGHTRPSSSSSSSISATSIAIPPSLQASTSGSAVIFTNTNPFDPSPSTSYSAHSQQQSIPATQDAHAAIRAAGKLVYPALGRRRPPKFHVLFLEHFGGVIFLSSGVRSPWEPIHTTPRYHACSFITAAGKPDAPNTAVTRETDPWPRDNSESG